MRVLLSWLAQTALLYVLLALAIGLAMAAWPNTSGFLEGWREDTASISEISTAISQARDAAQNELEERQKFARTASLEKLDARIEKRETERAAQAAELTKKEGEFLAR